MTETIPFTQSWGFWLILGLFIGAIFGFLIGFIYAKDKRKGRDEERWEHQAKVNKAMSEVEKAFDKIGIPLHKGTPDRE